MDIEKEVIELRKDVSLILGKIENMKSLNEVIPMLIKWVLCPLVSILAAGFGVERIVS